MIGRAAESPVRKVVGARPTQVVGPHPFARGFAEKEYAAGVFPASMFFFRKLSPPPNLGEGQGVGARSFSREGGVSRPIFTMSIGRGSLRARQPRAAIAHSAPTTERSQAPQSGPRCLPCSFGAYYRCWRAPDQGGRPSSVGPGIRGKRICGGVFPASISFFRKLSPPPNLGEGPGVGAVAPPCPPP